MRIGDETEAEDTNISSVKVNCGNKHECLGMGLDFTSPGKLKVGVRKHVEKMISRVMTPPNFPIKYSDLKAKITYKNGCPEKFKIGSITIINVLSGIHFMQDY